MVITPNNGINGPGTPASGTSGRTKPAETSPSPHSAPASSEGGIDNVSLSSQAHSLAKLEADLGTSADVDSAKVAEIKAAITSGEYRVNPEAIADKMLDEDGLAS